MAGLNRRPLTGVPVKIWNLFLPMALLLPGRTKADRSLTFFGGKFDDVWIESKCF